MIMPKVSTIIPTYNRKEYVVSAIDHVLAQTVPSDEIIIVDDGSTDGTDETVAELSGKYPQIVYIRQENRGAGAARNQGIIAARNSVIAFLDSDDTWYPRHLEESLDCFSLFPKAGVIFAKYELKDKQKLIDSHELINKYHRRDNVRRTAIKRCGVNYLLDPAKCLHSSLLGNIGFSNSTMVINRERCGTFLFDETLKTGQDVDFRLQLFAAGIPTAYIDSLHSEYLIHGNNTIMTKSIDLQEKTVKLLCIKKHIEKKAVYCRTSTEYDLVHGEMSRCYRALADSFCEQGKYSEAQQWYRLSYRMNRSLDSLKHVAAFSLLKEKNYVKLHRLIQALR